MIELGELEKRHADFDARKLRIVAVSNDDLPTSNETHEKFPNLSIASDPDQKMARAFAVIHEKADMDGKDTNAPTTFLVDGGGTIRWLFRPDRFFERLSPDQLLAAVEGASASDSGSR